MGYTNYWHVHPYKKELSQSIIGKVKKILSTYEETYGQPLVACFGCPDEKPTITNAHIEFNTTSENTGEDFWFNFDRDISQFCKTCRENYDAAVKAVLMVLKSAGYLLDWSFDGDVEDDEYKAGIALLEKAGIKYNNRMKPTA